VDDLAQSPVFDGSDTSMSGDGAFVEHGGSSGGGRTNPINMPSGKGGGCVMSGPFVKYGHRALKKTSTLTKPLSATVNLGPLAPGMAGQGKVTAMDYNPRCVIRDLTSYATAKWMTYENLFNLTFGPASVNIAVWQDELQGRGFPGGFLGTHATGHYAMGGNAADLWSSNNDPAFYLHHGMVDRLWTVWQLLYPDRAIAVAGTMTINNSPPSRNGTLDDEIDLTPLGWPKVVVRDLMDPMGGAPLCYMYE
jgi:tyrosinase